MCGRFTLHLPTLGELRAELEALGVDELFVDRWLPRYNIAPTQDSLVVRARRDGRREARMLHWGLVPPWAQDPSVGVKLINARVESVADRPSFRAAFAARRCLIPASGFYEWRPLAGERTKEGFWVHPRDASLMTFAGLWEQWRSTQGEVITSFGIVTTEAHGALRDIHDRMPLVLRAASRERWLRPGPLDRADVADMVQANADVRDLDAYTVGPQVNAASHDAPDCIEPAPDRTGARQLDLF